jgi:RNA polymerase sigma factor (sigma-70 family)
MITDKQAIGARDFEGILLRLNDDQLVRAAKSGDGAAFAELGRRHSRTIQLKVYRIVGNWEDAQDILQDSLLRAFRNLDRFEGRCSFSTWLTKIAINSALMMLRKKRRRAEVSFDPSAPASSPWNAWEVPDLSPCPERVCAAREKAELIRGAVRRLPRNYRMVMEQFQVGESSMIEIARALGISTAAAKSRLLRARTALRASLPQTRVSM